MSAIAAIIVVLIFTIFFLLGFSVLQLRNAGINVKDFLSFIDANQNLDRLYSFAKEYDKLSPQEQVLYLAEAEKMFDAFDKIPVAVWEDEHEKYSEVLDRYKDIKIMRWNEAREAEEKIEKKFNKERKSA